MNRVQGWSMLARKYAAIQVINDCILHFWCWQINLEKVLLWISYIIRIKLYMAILTLTSLFGWVSLLPNGMALNILPKRLWNFVSFWHSLSGLEVKAPCAFNTFWNATILRRFLQSTYQVSSIHLIPIQSKIASHRSLEFLIICKTTRQSKPLHRKLMLLYYSVKIKTAFPAYLLIVAILPFKCRTIVVV